jgi:acyl dehydratase
MDAQPVQRRGMYFEEFEVGQRVISPGRTVTEADIVTFAGLSGDFNSIHTDAAYSQTTPFGQRVAHGLLGLAIASGLAVRTGIMEGTVLAFREIGEWKFSRPIHIGDTIHIELEIQEVKPMPRLGGGSLLLGVDVKNQADETTMRGKWSVLVQSRPGQPA